MEKISARLFVPLAILLIGVLTLVACKIHDASYSEENAIFLWRRQGGTSTPSPNSIGGRCTHSNTNPHGGCTDPHAECATNNTCVCSADYVLESSVCKAKVDISCARKEDCLQGADCVDLSTTNSPAPTAHQPGVTTSPSPTQLSKTTLSPPATTPSSPATTPSSSATTPSSSATTPSSSGTTPSSPATTPSSSMPHARQHMTQLSQMSPHSADKSTDAPTGRRKRQNADLVCRCETDHYYATKVGTCASRMALDATCEPLESGHSPCLDPNVTVCHKSTGSGFTCQCKADFFPSSGTSCTPRLKAGTPCPFGADVCVKNATCPVAPTLNPNTTTPGYVECTCDDDYFRDNDGLCQPRVKPGQSCPILSDGGNPCVENAHCHGICQCPQDRFKQTASGCQQIFEPGTQGCGNDDNNCVANAECIHDYCECKSGFFDNSTIHLCQLRKAPMSSCLASVECVPNAACRSSVCTCEEHYYADPQRCNPRLSFNHDCHVSDKCLLNGECIQGHCLCNDKSFNNENTNCPLTLNVGDACNWYNNDPRQCQSNTTCVFRPRDSHPVCGCDIDHFFNSQYCVKRALAGDPCPYETRTSMGLSMENDEFLKQCVENAHCEDTYKVCKCNDDHYNRAGRCPLQIAVDGYCDPWTDNIDQCASNAQCVFGRCVGGVTGAPVVG